jgi:outer membrane protein TolC
LALATLDQVRIELIPLQESRRTQAEAAYKAGQTDITSLVLADQDLQGARTKLIELQSQVVESLIRLERAAGGSAHAPATTQTATDAGIKPASVPTP